MSAQETAVFEKTSEEGFAINGVIDFHTVPSLQSEIARSLRGVSSAIVSLGGVERCNSVALALMLEMMKLMGGRPIRFTEVPEELLAIARAYGVADELLRDNDAVA